MVAPLPLGQKGKRAGTSQTREEGPHSALAPGLPHEASGGLAQGLPHLAPVPHLGRRGGALALLPAGIAQVGRAAAAVVALRGGAEANASLVSRGRGSGRGMGEGECSVALKYIYVCVNICGEVSCLKQVTQVCPLLNISLTAEAGGDGLGRVGHKRTHTA